MISSATLESLWTLRECEYFGEIGGGWALMGNRVCLLNYRDDGVTPYFTFWADGLKKEKV